ncbi:MAG: aldehyde dehydrogenase family protein [Planctomycetota bacterium]
MLREKYPYYLAGQPAAPNADLVVTNKYTGQPAARVAQADRAVLQEAISAAAAAFEQTRKLPAHQRQAILNHLVRRVEENHAELSQVLAVEVGKPIRDARGEVTRLVDTLRIAAEEAVRIGGEWLPLDISPRAEGYQALLRRFPIGPCAFITPFNFPLNLAAHKIAPAIAVGCPWILKPASATPISSIMLGEYLAETDWPRAAFSILPCPASEADLMVTDERIKKLSFTGSPEVGWRLKARAGQKRVTLELGGNAACIVDRGSDLDYAAQRITLGAFYQSGQSCISVQRVLAHAEIHDALLKKLIARARELKYGDPLAEDTFLGPLITLDDAKRVESWVDEAIAAGARLLCGGRRHGPCYEATYLENVDPRQKVSCVEVFGPVATIQPFENFPDAIRLANDSRYGLQCGVFTPNLNHAFYAFEELEVGGVVINDIPSMRVDAMPYGGVKDSGQGREGVRYAIEEMTERRLLVLNRAGQLA